jgi:hypothetical protein
MTITINIQCGPEDLDAHFAALGLMRNPTAALGAPRSVGKSPDLAAPYGAPRKETLMDDEPADALSTEFASLEHLDDLKSTGAEIINGRVRGQPSPGKKRRTPQEVADDTAWEANRANRANDPRREPAGISTGEARVDPADAAQDEADEAAETAARPSMEDWAKLTLPQKQEHLRGAAGRYTAKFGYKAWIDNVRDIIGCALIEVPEDGIEAAIGRVEAAINGSTVLGVASPGAAPAATKADVVAALTVYGKKYDGVEDPAKMLVTREDMPRVLEELFGAGIKTVPSIPQTPEAYGRAVAAIAAATRDNPFKRETRS